MEASVNAFDLSPEQQDTLALLRRLLGKAIPDRYTDFCRLAAGAFELNVHTVTDYGDSAGVHPLMAGNPAD